MPIHELGYRPWQGALRPRWLRFWCITRTGIALALRTRLTRRLSLLALVPVLYFGPLFFAIGILTDPTSDTPGPWRGLALGFLENEAMLGDLQRNPALLRGPLWNDIFLLLQSTAQLLMSFAIVATVAPALISRDLRSKAFLIYFSKPITRLDYLAGKAGVVIGYLLWFTLLPSLAIYLLSIAFSPSAATFAETAAVVPKIALASLVTIVPLTAVSLFLSAMTRDERVATFAWIVLFLGGELAYRTLDNLPGLEGQDWTAFLCLRESVRTAIQGIYEAPVLDIPQHGSPGMAAAWLGVVSLACTYGIWRRISAPMRI